MGRTSVFGRTGKEVCRPRTSVYPRGILPGLSRDSISDQPGFYRASVHYLIRPR